MRTFNYSFEYKKLLSPEIVSYLTRIHEMKGQQKSFLESKEGVWDEMIDVAKTQSIETINHIEGFSIDDERLNKIIKDKTLPTKKSESIIAGYRDTLNYIQDNYGYISVNQSMILQLHQYLYTYSKSDNNGRFRNSDNIISEELTNKPRTFCFEHVPVEEITESLENLCCEFEKAVSDPELDDLLLISLFVVDFLCICPFDDGNDLMSRLLTQLLLYRSEYYIGKYISIDKLISDSEDRYYSSLKESSLGWYDGENNYIPFVRYFLDMIITACQEYNIKVDVLMTKGFSKPDRVREIIQNTNKQITKSQIRRQCPDISQKTVERALAYLLESEKIIKIGGGRYTSYTWNRDKEKTYGDR